VAPLVATRRAGAAPVELPAFWGELGPPSTLTGEVLVELGAAAAGGDEGGGDDVADDGLLGTQAELLPGVIVITPDHP